MVHEKGAFIIPSCTMHTLTSTARKVSPSTSRKKRSDSSLHEDEHLHDALLETFGIERLRTGQREVIDSVINGVDTLAVMPTGSGKSLCYQLPALKLPGMTLV